MDTPTPRSESSWFRGRGGRRYGRQIAALFVLKLVLLATLWAVCIRPVPRADTSPAAVGDRLLAPVAGTPDDR